jgi:hypothetical protein
MAIKPHSEYVVCRKCGYDDWFYYSGDGGDL